MERSGEIDLFFVVVYAVQELHRVALWIDCNARFFAACLEPEKQAQGEIVMPALE